jgi:branched-chain amino acid transport system substrate-binding protein
LPTGTDPSAVTAGAGAVWTLNANDRTITRVDLRTKARRTLGLGASPTDLAFGLGELWVATAEAVPGAQFAGRTATAVVRVDPATGIAREPIALPPARGVVSNVAANLAFAAGAAWMINPDFSLSRIDPRRNEVVAVLKYLSAIAVASDGHALWVLNDDRTLARIDTATNRVVQRVKVPAAGLNAIAIGAGSVWALDPSSGRLWRIEPTDQLSIDVGAGSDALAFSGGSLWVSNSLLGVVLQFDPATDRVVRRITIGATPRDVSVADGRVWVAVAAGASTAAQPARLGDVEPIASGACGPPLAGSAAPELLIASDLPLQGGPRIPSQQMAAAIVSVLRDHRFRAGRFAVAYQSCDDSLARTRLFDLAKCAGNAKAFVATPELVGVVGPMNSGCAYAQVPIAGSAALALISPTATDVGLTRPPPDAPLRAERKLYPTGVHTFARLLSPDDAQGAALAVLVHRLGARRPYVLHDGGFGAGIADAAGTALRRLGTAPAGIAGWDWKRRRYGPLVHRVRAARPDGLVVCGLLDTDAGAVLRAIRPVLRPDAPVAGCEGLLPSSLLFRNAGGAARGIYVTQAGLSVTTLPAAGRAFAQRLGQDVNVYAVYAAAATEALLDAIAASDGTRALVSANLMKTRVIQSLIGPYAIDANGDPDPAPVSAFRLDRPGRSDAVLSDQGARTLKPISPPRRLWADAGKPG